MPSRSTVSDAVRGAWDASDREEARKAADSAGLPEKMEKCWEGGTASKDCYEKAGDSAADEYEGLWSS